MKQSRYYFVIAILLLVLIATGCKDDIGTTSAGSAVDLAKMPTMVSYNVQTILSDSGETRYRITTKTWLAYENQVAPHWEFPHGLIAEELDRASGFKVKMSMKCDSAHYDRNQRLLNLVGNVTIHDNTGGEITCDSAYYDEEKALWSLNSQVIITNASGNKIETNQMYWDRKANKYYSDSFIRVQAQEKVLEGYGYESDDRMSKYTVRKVQAMVPVSDTRFPSF